MNPLRKLSANINAATAARTPPVVSTAGDASSAGGGDGEEPQFVFSMRFEDYELGNPIGYGSSAIVYIAKYLPINKIVAVKVIELDMFERNQIDELRASTTSFVTREIQIMSLSRHPNLLPVYGSFVHASRLYIVTPFLSAGSLLDIMKTAYPHGIEESCICTILRQALQGLEYLHQNGLIHRDVKAGNLLLAEDGLVQLGDFGVSSSLMETGERKGPLRKTFVGTPCWMAPEVMEQTGYDYKADIWSFGITALEMATGHAPFAKYPPLKVMMMTLQNEPPTLDREQTHHKYSKCFKDLIDTCLQKDPNKRPNATKLLQHNFFKQFTKKREHLATDLLQALPPITKRAHTRKTLPQQEDEFRGVSWDFSSEVGTPDATIGGVSNTIMSSLSALSSGSMNASIAVSAVPAAAEFKKGRFSVSESISNAAPQTELHGLGIVAPGSDMALASSGGKPDSGSGNSPVLSQADSSSPKLSRFTVTDTQQRASSPGNSDKRSRFEVHSLCGEANMVHSPSASLGRNMVTTSRLASSVFSGDVLADGVSESAAAEAKTARSGSGGSLAEENRALREENLTLRGRQDELERQLREVIAQLNAVKQQQQQE